MSNQSEQPLYLQQEELNANVKSGKWEYFIQHEIGKPQKGSMQYRHAYRDVKTGKTVVDHNTDIIAEITMKNGPYTEPGQFIPKDIIISRNKFESCFKTNVTFGTKSCHKFGEYTEWFNDNIWKSAVANTAKKLDLDENGTFNIAYDMYKNKFGSKQNPGDPKRKAEYMEAKDWSFTVTIRGNNKDGNCFGFTVYHVNKLQNGETGETEEVPINANNLTTWFRKGVHGHMIYNLSYVTMNPGGSVNSFYYGISPIVFFLKRGETNNKHIHINALSSDQKTKIAEDEPIMSVVANVDNTDIEQTDVDNNIEDNDTGPLSAKDISNQLDNLNM
jgi:hypothetical protein